MMRKEQPHGILRRLSLLLLLSTSAAQFNEFDYLRNSGPFCPNALELWYLRVPYGSGVEVCGEGRLDGPPLPERPTLPPVTSTTTLTRVTTLPGFQEEVKATCCTTLPPESTGVPRYTTATYIYVWDTSTVTSTDTTSSTQTTSSTTETTISTTTLTSSSTLSMEWWWNASYYSSTTSQSSSSSTVTQSSSTSSTHTTSTSSSITTSSTTKPWPRPSTSSTTFTSSSTNSTTVTTTTTTSSTGSSSSTETRTSSTSSTATHTNTSTTTSTSTTETSTSTVLPDPPVPCLPLCPRLTPTACRSELRSDRTCETSMLNSPCFEPSTLLFSCPGTNRDPLRHQDLEQGHYGVRCWICAFASSMLVDGMLRDVDLRTGWLMVDLKFGPNMLGRNLNEDHIDGYAIFMTDLEGERLNFSNPELMLPKKSAEHLAIGCCEEAAYSARVNVQLPPGTNEVRFEVVPILTGLGPLAVGRISASVRDASPFNQVTAFACQARISVALIIALGVWIRPDQFLRN